MSQEQLHDLQKVVNQELVNTYYRYKEDVRLPTERLTKAMEYALLNGGKRIRPLLTRLVCHSIGADIADSKVCELAIEAIHAYSLIHDDLPAMDDDELRRGVATTHIAFDEATAIIAGDALQALAFECLSTMPLSKSAEPYRIQLISTLASAAGARGMCYGQSLDLSATDKLIDGESLLNLHQHKTGALIKAAVKMALLLKQPVNDTTMQLFENYSSAIGLAFQIQDDILDETSDTKTLGKPQGSDKDLNKSTFVSIYGLKGAKEHLFEKQQQAMQCLSQLTYNTEELEAFTDLMVSRTF